MRFKTLINTKNLKQTIQVPIAPSSNLARNIKDKIKDVVGSDKVHKMTLEMG